MRSIWLTGLAAVALTACEAVPPSPSISGVFTGTPDAVTAPAPRTDRTPLHDEPGDGIVEATPEAFDFDADAPSDEPGAERSDDELMAAMGVAAMPVVPAPEPVVAPEPVIEILPVPGIAPALAWQPGDALPGGWGVRLVSTVTGAQPPRAILGLADGTEMVVEPGTLLPDARLVVLAIGRDAVQVAEVVPEGDRARVESRVLSALYPSTVVLGGP